MEESIMKKINLFAALAAALSLLACTKEKVAPEQNEGIDDGLVPFSFYATVDNSEGDDSKVFINSETGKVNWKSGDKLSVFDNADSYATNHMFTANADGAAVSFNGSLNAEFTAFTAIYPYSEDIVYDSGASNPIAYDIPVIQEAVKGSFDPKAARYVATGTNLSDNLSFKAAFALLKVNVDVEDVVALYVENTSRDMSGSVTISTGGGVGNGTGTRYRRITLKKSDDSVLEQGDYYIVVRFLNPDNLDQKYSNFKLTYIKEDASCLTRAAASDVLGAHVARGTVANLGSLSSFTGTPAVSWYTYYQAGLDVTIAGVTVNRMEDGDATLVSAASSAQLPLDTKVNFLQPGNHTNTNMQKPSHAVIMMSNDPTNKAVLLPDKTWAMQDFAVSDIIIDLTNQAGASMFSNAGDNITCTAKFFNLDKCLISVPATNKAVKTLYATNSGSAYLNYSVESFSITNCKIITPGASSSAPSVNLLSTLISINSSHTKTHEIKKLVFSNNLFYCTSGGYSSQIFNYSGSASSSNESDWGFDVVLNNNVLYNVANSNGYVRNKWIASLNIENNVFCIPNSYEVGGDPKIYNMVTDPTSKPSGTVKNNIVIGTPGSSKVWKLTNNAARTVVGAEDLSLLTEAEVFSSVNVSTGVFTMALGYEEYGPQGI